MHVAFVLLLAVGCVRAQITKTNKGYSGIVVAIHKSIPENTELIAKTLSLFNESSYFLYQVTGEKAFFRDITIVLPMSWDLSKLQSTISGVSYEKIYGDRYRDADIRIDQKSLTYEDEPYTLQTGGCFDPGQYIHLTPDFILDRKGVMTEIFGPKERQMVHEWMHLRYGVFDEYGIAGDEDFPLFYLEGGKMHVSACDRDIKGWIETETGQPCEIYEDHISEGCRFYPDVTGTESTSSLMSQPYIPSVKEFCDEDSEKTKSNRHNSKSPTKQNRFCDGLSIWEVMRRHDDFKNPPSVNEPYVPPNVRVVQPISLDPRFILVLDISSSMSPHMTLLNRAGIDFVEDQLPEGSFIGIVTYSSSAQTVQELVKVTSTNRNTISQRVPKSAGGYTAIGSGLLEALNVLRRGNQPTEGATIVLMTDGAENRDPRMNQVIPEIVKAKVKVNTLAFGKSAEKVLEDVAIKTKGKTYFFDPSKGAAELSLIFGDTVTIQADVDLQSEQLMRDHVDITSSEKTMTVNLDRELGKNTIFVVSGDVAAVDMSVVSPNGTRYNSASKEYQKDVHIKKRIQIRLPLAEPGQWNVTITRTGNSNAKIEMVMTSDPRNPDDQPIRVEAWLDSIVVKPPAVPIVYALVTKNNKQDAVIRANVEAYITMPNGNHIITLRDDGVAPDDLANDGKYSAFFTQYTANGRYSVFARVFNNGTALIKKKRTASRAPAIPKLNTNGRLNKITASSFDLNYFVQIKKPEENLEMKYNKTEPFTRTAEGGSFSVEGYVPNVDKIPPNKVSDLNVIENKIEKDGSKVVTIQWTSPGDNMDSGNASSLEIRITINYEELRKDKFQSAVLLNDKHLVQGSLNPVPSKEKQTITVRVPEEIISNSVTPTEKALDVYIALRAHDAAKNVADVSNIVSAHYGYEIPDPVKPTPEVKEDTKCKRRHFSNKLLLSLVIDNIDEL